MKVKINVGSDAVELAKVQKPDARTFRDAWALNKNKTVISVDMAAARKIQQDAIREERKPEFEKNDIDLMDAMASGDNSAKTAALNRQKALRDAPANSKISNAANADALAKITLEDVT